MIDLIFNQQIHKHHYLHRPHHTHHVSHNTITIKLNKNNNGKKNQQTQVQFKHTNNGTIVSSLLSVAEFGIRPIRRVNHTQDHSDSSLLLLFTASQQRIHSHSTSPFEHKVLFGMPEQLGAPLCDLCKKKITRSRQRRRILDICSSNPNHLVFVNPINRCSWCNVINRSKEMMQNQKRLCNRQSRPWIMLEIVLLAI